MEIAPYSLGPRDRLEGLDEPRLIVDSGLAQRIGRASEPTLRDFGLRLVRVKISGSQMPTVQIMAEFPDGTMTIHYCEEASTALSPVLDVEDLITHAYTLEVSSPGIDRPLVRESDFRRAIGHDARVEMAIALNGRKRFRGAIEAVTVVEGIVHVRLRLPADEKVAESGVELQVKDMAEARLVLTDDLIRETLRREKAALKQARDEARGKVKPPHAAAPAKSKAKTKP